MKKRYSNTRATRAKFQKDDKGEKHDGARISKSRGQERRKLCEIDLYMSRDAWATMWHVCALARGQNVEKAVVRGEKRGEKIKVGITQQISSGSFGT